VRAECGRMLEFCHAQGAAAGISFPPIEDLQAPFDVGRVLQFRTRQASSELAALF
jgi:hypothetical protein